MISKKMKAIPIHGYKLNCQATSTRKNAETRSDLMADFAVVLSLSKIWMPVKKQTKVKPGWKNRVSQFPSEKIVTLSNVLSREVTKPSITCALISVNENSSRLKRTNNAVRTTNRKFCCAFDKIGSSAFCITVSNKVQLRYAIEPMVNTEKEIKITSAK